MPCNDITELLKIKLDHDNRIINYQLIKKSCGGDVGEKGLILDWLKKFTADELLSLAPDTFLQENQVDDEITEYLMLKSFLAVRSGIAILLGKEAGGKTDFCTVDSIKYGPKAMILTAVIKIDALTDEIKSCGNNCGIKQLRK